MTSHKKPPGVVDPQNAKYTSGHVVSTDGSVAKFTCSTDAKRWPWLALPPNNPIVIQTQSFWASVDASEARGTIDKDKWSALTWCRWTLENPDAGHAVRGRFEDSSGGDDNDTGGGDSHMFKMRMFDAQDRPIVLIEGKGVVFRTRNFEQWRNTAKQAAKKAAGLTAEQGAEQAAGQALGQALGHGAQQDTPLHREGDAFDYADPALLSLVPNGVPFVSPLNGNGARALVTKANGFIPGHPYISGSGDHVNSAHLAEVARQVASLTVDGAPFRILSAEMDMRRYIELNVSFDIHLAKVRGNAVAMALRQSGQNCAQITLEIAPELPAT